ncbi:hypothetical protein NGTWS0302_16960 [Mycolicibacterium cyprinidarum]|uniref:Uncharacterized protein n=1 Tax=Mycolicibacterium cyprinidarum TaxID=2860311 RepID=A0ABQ4VD66_9MYCO|nr:hypothetical protein NGTWS1702_24590 [Mycolicibacterium sp. NGTWSNA01]GJF18577.1 hypothetical protein NGTWS0302_16960 [Mycolicibacterium sp. NGTWS0302]
MQSRTGPEGEVSPPTPMFSTFEDYLRDRHPERPPRSEWGTFPRYWVPDGDPVIELEDGHYKLRVRNRYLVRGNHCLPEWVEVEATAFESPDMHARIALVESVPRVTSLSWSMQPHQREVRQSDLRELTVSMLVESVYASVVIEMHSAEPFFRNEEIERLSVEYRRIKVRHLIEELRSPSKRRVTGEFLREVADVYRSNIDHAPTQAVARTYGVKLRQAGDYVRKARDRGFLPEAEQGRARA